MKLASIGMMPCSPGITQPQEEKHASVNVKIYPRDLSDSLLSVSRRKPHLLPSKPHLEMESSSSASVSDSDLDRQRCCQEEGEPYRDEESDRYNP